MSIDPAPSWTWPDWWREARSGHVSKVEMPDAGGWMYQFQDGEGSVSHVFVPDMNVWTVAIADAIVAATAQAKTAPVSITLDFTRVRRVKQPIPTVGGSNSP